MGTWSNRLKFPLNSTTTTRYRNQNRKPTTGATTHSDRETMVAISLYRGNMHRVSSELPRRWLMPTRKITLKDFRTLLHRRSKSLSILPSSSDIVAVASTAVASTTVAVASTSAADVTNPNTPVKQEAVSGNPNLTTPDVPMEFVTVVDEIKVENDNGNDLEAKVLDLVVSLNFEEKEKEKEKEDEVMAMVECEKEKVVAMVECEKEKVNGEGLVVEIPVFEGNDKLDNADDKEKRKTEVEEKLKILNEKKHNLVQALKQILNAEEELNRRSCMQAGRPSLPSQTDVSNDSGSMTRHATPKTGSEANITVDVEGGEGDDALNHNPQFRPLLHMNCTSPSAESALRRPPYFHHNAASHSSRASIVVAGSPSRFAPAGNQGQPSNLPSVCVSGTNYVASSLSPAASGSTSGLKYARHPSPWN